ncbi:MAG: acyltransferase family protein [Lachnospiraceae bacterium]|nr:acyltransferase family protein [Lachnospiraceae bacterium]
MKHSNNNQESIETISVNATTKKRIKELDMVKGLVIILVVLRHINELTGISGLDNFYTRFFSTFFESFMILYFLCSGYVYKSKGTVLQDIGKKAKDLLCPFIGYGIFDTAIYFLRYIVIEKQSILWFLDNTLTNFAGLSNWNIRLGIAGNNQMHYAFVPYWFVLQLFAAFCLFIPIEKMVRSKGVAVRILVAVFLVNVSVVLNHYDVQHTLTDTFSSSVSLIFVLINIVGFAGVLMIGSLLNEIAAFDIENQPVNMIMIMMICCLGIGTILFLTDKDSTYALQYGRWGDCGSYSIILTIIGGISVIYFLAVCMHFARKIPGVENFLCYLGVNSLSILMMHFIVAETICWIRGYWFDVYHDPYPMEKISISNYLITVLGTAVILFIYMELRYQYIRRKQNRLEKIEN